MFAAAGCTANWMHSNESNCCRNCGAGNSTAWSVSTCCVKDSDLPEVSLVAILDADKEGFLRSETSLIQTIGRAARNVNSQGDPVRRQSDRLDASWRSTKQNVDGPLQHEYNEATRNHAGNDPQNDPRGDRSGCGQAPPNEAAAKTDEDAVYVTLEYVEALEQEMLAAAENLEFERAASLRDRVLQLKDNIGKTLAEVESEKPASVTGRQRKRRKGVKGGAKVPRPKRG